MNGKEMTLLSVHYDGDRQQAVLYFYNHEDNKIYKVYDMNGHLPYCLSNIPVEEVEKDREIAGHPEYAGVEKETRIDPFSRKLMLLSKIKGKTPTGIGGREDSIREILKRKGYQTWEDDIRYKFCYAYDMELKIGRDYYVGKTVVPVDVNIPSSFIQTFADAPPDTRKMIIELAQEFFSEVKMPAFTAMDIEVEAEEESIPRPEEATHRIIAVSFVSGSYKKVYLLEREGFEHDVSLDGIDVILYSKEDALLRAVFDELNKHPIILTYNGDNFDFPYLYHRAIKLQIPRDEIPFIIVKDEARMKNAALHLDLYRFFQNPAIQTYAFGNVYREYKLDAVANALLGHGKVDLSGENIAALATQKLAVYCVNDAQLLYDLITFSNGLVYKIIVLIARISKTPIDEVVRHNISSLIRNLMEYLHRKRGWRIPNREELEKRGKASTIAITRGKKYLGGYVKEPSPGTYFDVYVLDFASLYPSLIAVKNLSYETINCDHEECRTNQVPDTQHWVCTKNSGITSEIVNALRLIRIKWFKKKAKDPSLSPELREWYNVVQSALKVFINASYGVFGAEHFRFYCIPVAESTAAYARLIIKEAMQYAESLGMEVLYGDTDSLFIRASTREKINNIISWTTEKFGIDLEIDKHYRFVIFSKRKKNYLGVFDNGNVDIKGLTGKKSNTPLIIRAAFEAATKELSNVTKEDDITKAIDNIKKIVRETCERIKKKNVTVEEVSFVTQLTRPLKSYSVKPQHVIAALQLESTGRRVMPGQYIYYIKTRDSVKAAELAAPDEIDPQKYIEHMQSVFEQVLEPLDIEFDNIIKEGKGLFQWM
ncbi:MAG: DNA-directed DNA polymerase I [Candidatus Korarchaeota archaeon]